MQDRRALMEKIKGEILAEMNQQYYGPNGLPPNLGIRGNSKQVGDGANTFGLGEIFNNEQLKGAIYGLGTAVLAGMFLPTAGKKLHSLAVNTMEEGFDLVDRARSVVIRAKEGLEDIVAEASFNHFQAEFMKDLDGNGGRG